jgi:hypothetical protein
MTAGINIVTRLALAPDHTEIRRPTARALPK